MPPLTTDESFRLAMQHHQAGRLPQAEAVYRQILAEQPDHADALHLLGLLASQYRRQDVAVELIGRAIALQPGVADYHVNIGNALHATGRLGDAIASYRRALELKPEMAEVYSNLGIVLHLAGQSEEAAQCHLRAIALKPDYAEAYNNLGNILRDQRRYDEAIACFERALERKPNYVNSVSNLGNAYVDAGRIDEGVAMHERAVALRSDYAEARANLGSALFRRGDVDRAIESLRQAIALKPDLAEARMNLGMALLLRGEPEGWAEYEWRWRSPTYVPARRRFSQPRWNGEPLAGQTILLHPEQGLGDAIHFVRYLPHVERMGGEIVAECQPSLARLFRESYPRYRWVAAGEALPRHDVHCPLMSLPLSCGAMQGDYGPTAYYLRAEAATAEKWRQRLAGTTSFKVGLVWAGSKTHKNDRNRSIGLATLAALGRANGVTFVSLQKGDDSRPPAGLSLVDWTNDLHDFADTAGLIANLDLVISVDTSVAHLAGAMGKPVWTLLPFAPDWRWLLGRDDSPWYPTMRLFRQSAAGDWGSVVDAVCGALDGTSGSKA